MKTLSDKAKSFLKRNPTKIGTVGGVDFYEHPVNGDESPMYAITNKGKLKITDFWELPNFDDVLYDSNLFDDVNNFNFK